MEVFKAIAMLCQLTCSTNLQEVQKQQIACHQFYAQCLTEEKASRPYQKEEDTLKVCMDRRYTSQAHASVQGYTLEPARKPGAGSAK